MKRLSTSFDVFPLFRRVSEAVPSLVAPENDENAQVFCIPQPCQTIQPGQTLQEDHQVPRGLPDR